MQLRVGRMPRCGSTVIEITNERRVNKRRSRHNRKPGEDGEGGERLMCPQRSAALGTPAISEVCGKREPEADTRVLERGEEERRSNN